MSEKNQNKLSVGPFGFRIDAAKQSDFDKYYYDIEYKEVFKETGVDADGDKTGVIETKAIIKKIDIAETIRSQADSVGVEAYIRALTLQGVNVDEINTVVDDNVNDFSNCPDTLADTMLLGDKARSAFDKLDPALKGNHTTIEGFLNSLSSENIDSYIQGKIEALLPNNKKKEEVE